MRPLVWALLAFALAVLLQWIVWRTRRPKGPYAALAALCLATLFLSLSASRALRVLISPLDYANFAMLYIALVLAYMTTFSAVQADSPTMVILLGLEQSGPAGLTLEELVADVGDQVLIVPRLADLVSGNLVTVERGRYVIRLRGALMARVHVLYRSLLGMEKGG